MARCMADKPNPEDVALWQKRLASHANNRAWTLAEALHRAPEEDEEMLQAAYAAAYFWRIVGGPGNRARAALLLAHVHALLALPTPATRYLRQSMPYFMENDCAIWEQAVAHAVAANVAFAEGNAEAHAEHYAQAMALTSQAGPEEREMLKTTLRVVPSP